ncbi:hypothetical protein JW707_05165 [Candidatus Woesearchaeota archaeon]|nr:hypothetical protein [Candidatus Woesearchaeota archaeon]
MRKSRKAQIMGQVFIFILAAALFILILTYGYKAIAGFGKRSEQVALVEFQTQLESSVRSISLDYGSIKQVDLALPSKYTEICFVDLEKSPSEEFEQIHPRMYEAWETGTQNVFLTPMEEAPINVGKIFLGPSGFLCLPITAGKISLRLEGLGDKAAIAEWQ